ncbi:hypothetical protein [Sphingobacterium thalpophilum]|uniref:hypothetical protein n=1 Tax=Sphingobacterium thalpophilum TaxID=259 RepID=UPI0024A75A7D|nr:hypothetical protein [Sphingobacterium thalpophilum]
MKINILPPDGYVEHMKRSALLASQAVGIEAGIRILTEGLKQWPEELEACVKWVVMERKRLKENQAKEPK